MSLPFHKLLQTISSGSSIGSAAVAILASYGTDAHIYLPGIGTLNGYTLGNYLDSGGVTPATVDNPVGLVQDAIGSIHASQGTTASKPILRKPSNNYYLEFDGTNDVLATTISPWIASDDYCITMGLSKASSPGTAKRVLHVGATASSSALAPLIVFASGGNVEAYWRDNSAVLLSASSGYSHSANVPFVVSARKVGNSKVCRVNGTGGAAETTAIGASAALDFLSIGAWGASYFDGMVYPTILIKGTVSDANLLILERWVGSLTGPTGVAI